VKRGVDYILSNIDDDYEKIGVIENKYGARPAYKKEGNCFVLKKR
jgi:hypothetical protein